MKDVNPKLGLALTGKIFVRKKNKKKKQYKAK